MPRKRDPPGGAVLSPGDVVDVRIERIVYGGDGLGRVGGRVLLVPLAAPGDRLRVRIVADEKRVLRGAIEAILEPSPARTAPECRHFGACGGCQLQHLDRASELAAKREFLRDCLRRIGGIRWDGEIGIDAGDGYGWRARADLHVERAEGRPARAGYFRAGSHEVVAIEDCPILVPALRRAVLDLARDASAIPPRADRIALVAGDDGDVAADPFAAGELPGRVRQRIGAFELVAAPGSFSQANPAMAAQLVARATGGARGRHAVDLYAGAGLFTLPLARAFDLVDAVEADAKAVGLGRENAAAHGIGNVRWSNQAVAEWLAAAPGAAQLPPDFLLLDPPRAGAGREAVLGIASLRPREIRYVSCDPATLARDLRLFLECGYAIREVAALDMFPRSYHLEAVVHLESSPA